MKLQAELVEVDRRNIAQNVGWLVAPLERTVQPRRSATSMPNHARKEPRIMKTTVINTTEYRNVSLSLLSESKNQPAPYL
jgi:hypothetical protein